MKKGFTLIEMMIVVAILVVLMTIGFKLMSLGSDSERRTRTIVRLQRLENCLSGYNAAFGGYPPVKLHGTRNIYAAVDESGLQDNDGNENTALWNWSKIGESNENRAWAQVQAACKAQPIDCRFPFPDEWADAVEETAREMHEYCQDEGLFKDNPYLEKKLGSTCPFDSITRNTGRLKNNDEMDWRNIQLFKFGLMSFLLPRYLVMMNGPQELFEDYKQWTGNNVLPSDPFTGGSFNGSGDWNSIHRAAGSASNGNAKDLARLANVPNQAICARWMPNLEGICKCNHSFSLFGVNIRDLSDAGDLNYRNVGIEVYHPAGGSVGANQYVLDGVTVHDGWDRDFYYYSPAPYQTYTLWSAGPNGRTFPPWVSRGTLSRDAGRCVGLWIADDIIHMKN